MPRLSKFDRDRKVERIRLALAKRIPDEEIMKRENIGFNMLWRYKEEIRNKFDESFKAEARKTIVDNYTTAWGMFEDTIQEQLRIINIEYAKRRIVRIPVKDTDGIELKNEKGEPLMEPRWDYTDCNMNTIQTACRIKDDAEEKKTTLAQELGLLPKLTGPNINIQNVVKITPLQEMMQDVIRDLRAKRANGTTK